MIILSKVVHIAQPFQRATIAANVSDAIERIAKAITDVS